METIVFVVPVQKDVLLRESSGQYNVQELIDLDECLTKIKDVKKAVSQEGSSVILNYFDTYFSLLYDEDKLNILQLQDIYDSSIYYVLTSLEDYVKNAHQLKDRMLKQEAVNVIKMTLYILFLFMKTYDDKFNHKDNCIIPEKKMRTSKVKGKNTNLENIWDWNETKKSFFFIIYSLLVSNINNIWPTNILDRDFVGLLGNFCFKAYEDPDIVQSKLKPLRDSVSQVLALLVTQYHYGISFIPKAVELMKRHEHSVTAITSSVMIMVSDGECASILPQLLTELQDEINVEDMPCLSKAAATFINDFAETDPLKLYNSISILRNNLLIDAYAVRNATLTAFTEIILVRLVGELDDNEKKMRKQLFEHLLNHLRDENAYVRSKALQLWTKLASAHAIPKDIVLAMLQVAVMLINNKSAFVAKSALQYFTVILKENPFAGSLDVKDMENQLLQAQAVLGKIDSERTLSREKLWDLLEAELIMALTKEISQESNDEPAVLPSNDSVAINDVIIILTKLIQEKHFVEAYRCLKQSEVQFPKAHEIRCNLPKSDKVEYYLTALKKIFLNVSGLIPNSSNFDDYCEEYDKQLKVVTYMRESIAFAEFINKDVKTEVEKVLFGRGLIVVLEAIEFFTVAFQFKISNSREIIRTFLIISKCKQPGVKEAVASAYKRIYLKSNHTDKGLAVLVCQRMIKLLKSMNADQMSSYEELVGEWINNNDIPKRSSEVLWEIFSKKTVQNDSDQCAALMLLNIVYNSDVSKIHSNVNRLVKYGLSSDSCLYLVELCCLILSKLGSVKENGKYTRFRNHHVMFENAMNIVVDNFCVIPAKKYIPMSLAVINMCMKLALYPETLMASLIQKCYEVFIETSDIKEQNQMDSTQTSIQTSSSDSKVNHVMTVREILLTRLFYIFGEIIFRCWVYLDRDVLTNIQLKEANAEIKEDGFENDEDEYEIFDKEATNADITNAVTNSAETIILEGGTINAYIRDLIVQKCKDLKETPLNTAATVSLCKLMLVSREFCENNIQLYMTIMERSSNEIVRSNLVLGIGDLITRFPNVIEPWTPKIYLRLKDESKMVKKHTVLVICHLINREMIKVRGQIAELCLCMEDEDTDTGDLVRCLFLSLSQKGNSLYNVVIDIIARLSDPNRPDPVPSEVFDKIMTFILKLITKERHCELLVEKICIRLKEAIMIRQWKDLAFCLSQLNFSEKSLRFLVEILPKFTEALMCSSVYNVISNILSTATKSTKPNVKEIGTEGQTKLRELLSVKDDVLSQTMNGTAIEEPMTAATPARPPPSAKPSSVRSTRTTRQQGKKVVN